MASRVTLPTRVLFLEWAPSSRAGGQELGMFDVCTGLSQSGMQVVLAHCFDGDLLPAYRAAGVETIRVRRYELDKTNAMRSGWQFAASVSRLVRVTAQAIVANAYHSTPLGAVLARAKGVPLLCHLRLCPPDGMGGQWRLGTRSVSRFIAVSAAVKAQWAACGVPKDDIDVVYEGIRTDRFRPLAQHAAIRERLGLAAGDFVLLSVGRISPEKNLDGLLRTFARVLQQEPCARLLIVGAPLEGGPTSAYDHARQLRALAASLGVGDRVQWLGIRDDMPELYNAADVTLQLSHRDALPRTLIESHLCGTPSVANSRDGMPEILYGEGSRGLVDARDVGQAAAAALQFVNWRTADATLAQRLRVEAMRRFSVEAMVVGVAGSIARALAEPAKRPRRTAGWFSPPMRDPQGHRSCPPCNSSPSPARG